MDVSESTGDEPFLRFSLAFDHFNNARFQAFDTGDMIGQNTHITRVGSDVDLSYPTGSIDGLVG